MTATAIRNRALDGEFLAILAATLCIYGQTVVNEAPATPNHAARLTYALACFANAEGQAQKLGFAIATIPAIQAAASPVPDATMLTVVTAAWEILAQVP